MESPSKIFASALGLTAFAVATTAGLANGAAGGEILIRAIISMVVCYPIGLVLGFISGHAVDEFTAAYKSNQPVCEVPSLDGIGDSSEIIDVDVL
ncbi:MAG: hypothetical protein K8E66_09025 [Phycisphaerales bacterium]|nr:hypothetical protein [Phycisphaerales bacterium]